MNHKTVLGKLRIPRVIENRPRVLLGSYIAQSQSLFRFDQVFAGIIVISIVSYTIEKVIFEQIENRVLVRYGLVRI